MSRSYRKPYSAITGHASAKQDKVQAHRSVRAAERQAIRTCTDWDSFLIPHKYECNWNDPWGWGRDGKQRLQTLNHQNYNPFYLHTKHYTPKTYDELVEDCLKHIKWMEDWIAWCRRK